MRWTKEIQNTIDYIEAHLTQEMDYAKEKSMKKINDFLKLSNCQKYFWLYLAVGVLFSFVSIIVPTISGELVNAVVYAQKNVAEQFTILLFVYVLLLFLSIADQYCMHLYIVKQKKEMRDRLFEAFLKNKSANRESISKFVSFNNNDVPSIAEDYFSGLIDIIKCICIVVTSSIALLSIHWTLAVIICGISILIVKMPNIVKEKAALSREKYANVLGNYNVVLESLLGGFDLIKSYLYKDAAQNQIREKNEGIEKYEKKVRGCQTQVYSMAGGLQIGKKVLMLTVGVYLIYMQKINVGDLLVAVQLAEIIAAPIEVLAYLINGRNECKLLVKTYKEILEIEEEKANKDMPLVTDLTIFNLSCKAEKVDILSDISYRFEKGKKYMLVGKSGSGKSTLLRILGRVNSLDYMGKVEISGVDITQIREAAFYEKVAIVFQEPYLFWASIKENILLGRSVDENEYRDVIQRVNLGYLLERYENQELNEEIVSKLSGGEKQRISLARALLGKPEIYLLDEFTSSLDAKNAYEIEHLILKEDAMVIHACHKVIQELQEKYDEVIYL